MKDVFLNEGRLEAELDRLLRHIRGECPMRGRKSPALGEAPIVAGRVYTDYSQIGGRRVG